MGFVAAWVGGGILAEGYSPVHDTISRLAEQGSATRPLMTAGFLGFGLLMPIFARELGRSLGSPGVRAAVTASALGTLAVAAFPVTPEGGTAGDSVHYAAAAIAYAANVAAPYLAGRRLPGPAGPASTAAAVLIAAALISSVVAEPASGLLQRTGLTLFDAWAVALAARGLGR